MYWTLQVELTFYVFVGLTLFFNIFNRPRVIIAATVLNAAIAIGCGLIRYFLHHKTPMYLPVGLSFIFLGNAFSLTKSGRIHHHTFFALASATWILLTASFWFGFSQDWGDGESFSRYLVTDTSALIFFYFFAIREKLDLRVLMWGGAISYPLYLLHEPIRVLATTFAPEKWELQFLFLAFAGAIIISATMHYCVERPFQNLGRRFANADWRRVLMHCNQWKTL